MEKTQIQCDKVKEIFDEREKYDTLSPGDLVLRWDTRREARPKHDKFDNLWSGPFCISEVLNKNTFILENIDGNTIFGRLVNGIFLK